MNNRQVEKSVATGVCELIRHKAFYGHLLQLLAKIYFDGDSEMAGVIPTMGVGKKVDEVLIKLYCCRDFVKGIFTQRDENKAWDELEAVLEHEGLHIIFDHLTLTFSDEERGAMAVDMAVNSCLDPKRLPGRPVLAENYGFPKHKSAMWYYNELAKNQKYQDQKRQQGAIAQSIKEAMNSHSLWGQAMKDPMLKDYVRNAIKMAKDLCSGKEWGDVPAEVRQHVEEILEKKKAIIPWKRVMRMFAASAQESKLDWTMKRESRRFGSRPGTRKLEDLNLAVGIDTSGSISAHQLGIFFNEVRWIWRNGALVTVMEADTEIAAEYRFRGKFSGFVHGRGGTDLEPVLKRCERKFDALIYFTDFYAPKIEKKYNIPVLWVLTTELDPERYPYKWGRHIRIENDKIMSME